LALRFIACLRCVITRKAFAHLFHYQNNKEQPTRKIVVGRSFENKFVVPPSGGISCNQSFRLKAVLQTLEIKLHTKLELARVKR
jgi:dihydroxyacid dehydratase/phosphogluconate dehydratase